MKLLKEIENQKALVEKLELHEKKNVELLKKVPDTVMTAFLHQVLEYNQMDITFRIKQQKALLAKMQADIPMQTITFEKDSREANMNIKLLIEQAGKPERFKSASEGVLNAIKDIVTKYNLEKDGMEQDDKNDLYFELKRLLNVAKKWK
jgi:hypothetical protein